MWYQSARIGNIDTDGVQEDLLGMQGGGHYTTLSSHRIRRMLCIEAVSKMLLSMAASHFGKSHRRMFVFETRRAWD